MRRMNYRLILSLLFCLLIGASSVMATAVLTPAANATGSWFVNAIYIPAISTIHAQFSILTQGTNFGTAGTLTAITGTTHANTTLDAITGGHGITNGQYITIAGEVGAFVVSGVGANALTLNRAATTNSVGHVLQYIQINDEALNNGYNADNNKTAEPYSAWVTESDYLNTDGYRYFESYLQFQDSVNHGNLVQIRPFFTTFNRDLNTLTYTWNVAGTRLLASGCGWSVIDSPGTHNMLNVCEPTGGQSYGTVNTNAQLNVIADGTNAAVINLTGTTNGANNGNVNINLQNTTPATIKFGGIGVNATVRTPGSESGTLSLLTTLSGDTTIAPLVLTGTTATFNQTNTDVLIPKIKSTTGARYVCIDTTGKLISQAAACVGT